MRRDSNPIGMTSQNTFPERVFESFFNAWVMFGSRMALLRKFCADIATVFTKKASPESEFSILNQINPVKIAIKTFEALH